MTKHQVKRIADLLDQLTLAAIVGAVADVTTVGQRVRLDAAGMAVGALMFMASIWLTGRIGGHKV